MTLSSFLEQKVDINYFRNWILLGHNLFILIEAKKTIYSP